ncbi:MAG TPA: galactokinase [Nocardioidaceae bacterium]|nr:galactokinase [Nocardioidaceae bacterium]
MPPSTPPSFASPGEPDQIAEEVAAQFTRRTGRSPSAVVAAPGRVNLIGEHLDYNGGRCLPLALPHATYAAVAPRTDRTVSVISEQMGRAAEIALDGLRPGAVTGWAAYVAGVVWALREDGWDVPGLEVAVDSRVPIGSGLSSSAALECAIALGVLAVMGVTDTDELRGRLVQLCVRAEAEMAGAPTGGMDQSVALLARAGHALLLDFDDGTSRQVEWSPSREGLGLLVVDTGVSHALTDGGYASRRTDCEEAARALGVRTLREARALADPFGALAGSRAPRRVRHVLTEMDRVDAAVAALDRGDHAALGPFLDASHDSLRDDFEVSCPELDVVVETCRRHGALGARLTGGGFGGSALALLPVGDVPRAAVAVAAAFEEHGWHPPAFLHAPAGAGARRLR